MSLDSPDSSDSSAKLLSDAYLRLRSTVSHIGAEQTGPDGTARSATLPAPDRVNAALAALPRPGHADYLRPRGTGPTLDHLVDTIVPALNGQNLTGRYYGFVTGSVLPVAEAADNIVTALDQNVHAHLPAQTVTTAVEAAALQMLVDFFDLPSAQPTDGDSDGSAAFGGRIFTTGATASNVLGLALGREAVIRARWQKNNSRNSSSRNRNSSSSSSTPGAPDVSEVGLLRACREAGVSDIRVLTSMAHSSLYKAASIVGLGRASIADLPYSDAEPWRLDMDMVEQTLAQETAQGVAHIIGVSAGEVNTGRFATTGLCDMQRLRVLADRYGAWIHVDAAFGLFARSLPDDTPAEFAKLRQHAQGIELADSITSDGHKLLNVPYDAGIFFSRYPHLQNQVFQNANAAYLTAALSSSSAIPSPMDMGIENSRRFRALPVYAVLLSEGRHGLAAMVARMVRLARGVHRILKAMPEYETLGEDTQDTYIGVLFWAKDDAANAGLATRINASREMYVSPTAWRGRPACRVAVSSWRVAESDLAVVGRVLRDAVAN